MRKINIHLDSQNNSSDVFTFSEFEEQILLEVRRNPDRTPLAYTLANDQDHFVKNGTSNHQFIRISRGHWDTIKLDSALANSSIVDVTLYIGTWGEILVTDLYIHLNQFYQSASETNVSFNIGLPNQTHLSVVKSNLTGNFTVNRILTISPTQVATQQETFDAGAETTAHLEQIYNRIIENQNNTSFMERQQRDTNTLLIRSFNFLSVY